MNGIYILDELEKQNNKDSTHEQDIQNLKTNKADKTYVDGQDTELENQIEALSGKLNRKIYSGISQFGLNDSELASMDLATMLHTICTRMGADSTLIMRLTSAVPNMRAIIGMNKASLLALDVVGDGIYRGELKFNDSNINYTVQGANLSCSGWLRIATDDDLLLKANKSETIRAFASNTHLHPSALEWAKANPNTISTYAGNLYPDLPPEFKNGWWGEIWTVVGSGTTVFLKENQGEKIWYRVINPSGSWVGDWKQLSTTKKTEIPFPFATGYTGRGGWTPCNIEKNDAGLIVLNLGVDGTITNTEKSIGFLPEGYRPPKRIQAFLQSWGSGTTVTGYVVIDANGDVRVAHLSSSITNTTFSISVSFYDR